MGLMVVVMIWVLINHRMLLNKDRRESNNWEVINIIMRAMIVKLICFNNNNNCIHHMLNLSSSNIKTNNLTIKVIFQSQYSLNLSQMI